MTFNIIYTPNSVNYLLHFIPSLLNCSPYNFCLVSNGCSPRERAILKKTVSQDKRLSYHCYPTNRMQIHGKVLTYLQSRCQEEYFCLMDSDIFATSPFKNLEKIMEKRNLTGLFSAMPIWVKESEYIFQSTFKSMVGTFNHTKKDICIGSTYFAIYNNDHLNQIIQHYGVCFDECSYLTLPKDIQNKLNRLGFPLLSFDTGKVINLFLNEHKFQLKNIKIPALYHIGGTSYETNYQKQSLNWKRKILQMVQQTTLKKVLDKRRDYYFNKRFKGYTKEEIQINYNQRILHRNPTRQHFLKLYLALANQQPLPPPPVFADIEITNNVAITHNLYIENFQKYHKSNQ